MMDTRGYQQYKEQSVSDLSQEELLLLLYDELVKRLLRCDLALSKEDYTLFDVSAKRCIEILQYLDDTLDPQYAVSRDLHRLYDFFLFEMNRVMIGRNKEVLDQIRPMITDLRDTFRTAGSNCKEEKAHGGTGA